MPKILPPLPPPMIFLQNKQKIAFLFVCLLLPSGSGPSLKCFQRNSTGFLPFVTSREKEATNTPNKALFLLSHLIDPFIDVGSFVYECEGFNLRAEALSPRVFCRSALCYVPGVV